MSQWFHPWQPCHPLLTHQVLNSKSNFWRLGVSWETRGLKDLTETDSTISGLWTSPSPDNHSQLAMADRGIGLLFFSLAREKWNKCPSLTHSVPSRMAGCFWGRTSGDGETEEKCHSTRSDRMIWKVNRLKMMMHEFRQEMRVLVRTHYILKIS